MPRPLRSHRARLLAMSLVAVLATVLASCRSDTVAIEFEPAVGDTFSFSSQVTSTVERTIEGETDRIEVRSELHVTETVTSTSDDEITVEVTVMRDGSATRNFEVRLDRTSRLAGIVLVEGVPTAALGLDLGAELPAGITGPPPGELGPGTSWTVDEQIPAPGIPEPIRVTGTGRIVALGVEDGAEVAEALVELAVPVRAVVPGPDGQVTLSGHQTTESTAAYDLDDGAVRREKTVIRGETDVIIEPPVGVAATPLRGSITYRIVTETTRIDD